MTQQGEPAAEDVDPDDSASAVLENCSSVTVRCVSSRHSKSSKVSSNASSLHTKEEANRAALLACTAAFKKKKALQLEEAQMEVKKIQLKAQMEELEVETAIAESTAKLQVVEDYDNMDDNGMNSYLVMNMHTAATIKHPAPDVDENRPAIFELANTTVLLTFKLHTSLMCKLRKKTTTQVQIHMEGRLNLAK